MTETHWLPPPNKDFQAAKRQFVELYGSTAVMNTYLKIAVVALCGVSVALVVLNLKTQETVSHVKPLVIRINDVGRAEALTYDAFAYRPQERELKYFLTDFVQRYYGRMRATVRDNFARSLYFLDARLADAAIETDKKDKGIERLLSGAAEEHDVVVKRVSIEDLRQAPYRATVDFDKVYYAADRTATRREQYVANVVFVVKPDVPNALIPINPLGVTITYFRQDQAFQ